MRSIVTVRATPDKRIWWRDVHAVGGAFVGIFLFFLALTGLPWSGWWGSQLNSFATNAGLGYPAAVWDEVPTSTVPMAQSTPESGWTLQNAPTPLSTPQAAAPIGIDRAAAIALELGVAPGRRIQLPRTPDGVYSIMIFPEDLAQQRVVHLDQYTGKPLVDVGVKDYGAVAQLIEWGISVHMGQEFGRANQIILALACLAVIVTSVAAVVMWWRRRPMGRLGAPPTPDNPRVVWTLLAIMAVFGILFPLSGVSLLIVLALDLLVVRKVPRLAVALR